jgi:hypothetical protein
MSINFSAVAPASIAEFSTATKGFGLDETKRGNDVLGADLSA